MYDYTQKDLTRFWSKVKKTSNCWEWQGGKSEKGYGRFKLKRTTVKAHRFIMSVFHPFPSPTIQVLHSCDNPGCVNPEHLFFGTNEDNMKDKTIKGRGTIGEKNPGSKLTETDVIKIRNSDKSRLELSKQYGVGIAAIDNIIKRRRWKHI